MKIDDALKKVATTSANDVKQRQTAKADAAKTDGAAKTATTSGSGNASSVVSISTQLQSMMEQVGDVNSFDVQKVEEIKAAIASGQFQVNPEKVADGLIRTVSELIQRPGK